MKANKRYSPEVRERAVRMVFEHQHEHQSQWATIESIAAKIGCTAETLRRLSQLFQPAVPRPAPQRARATRLSPPARPVQATRCRATPRTMIADGCVAQESPPAPRSRGSRWRKQAAEGSGTKKAFLFPTKVKRRWTDQGAKNPLDQQRPEKNGSQKAPSITSVRAPSEWHDVQRPGECPLDDTTFIRRGEDNVFMDVSYT